MSIKHLLERNASRRLRIVVCGDTLIDEYVEGACERYAQEAPAPVFRQTGEVIRLPGGAANVARQLKHWNAEVCLVSWLDRQAECLLAGRDIDTQYSIIMTVGNVPVKRRFHSRGQLLFRQDVEKKDYGADFVAAMRSDIIQDFKNTLRDGADVVILSDYAKGLFDAPTLRALIGACQERHIPVIADPHSSRHPHDFAGVTVFKPNEHYVQERGGQTFSFPGNLHWFKKTLSPTTKMVYTRGDQPPCGFIGDRQHAETFACNDRYRPVPVRSVVGAGDCFAAHLALAVAHGLDFQEACEIAYSAGRVYVTRPYNEPVMPHEVHADLNPVGAKIVNISEMLGILATRCAGKRVVYTNGVYRLGAHAGHGELFSWARRQGDLLIVGINDDVSAAAVRPGATVLSLRQRAALIAAHQAVDFVVPFSQPTPAGDILGIGPAVLVKGPDYAEDVKLGKVPGQEYADVTLAMPPGEFAWHSTDLESAIRNNGAAALSL